MILLTFFKINFFKKNSGTLSEYMSNSLDPDQDQHYQKTTKLTPTKERVKVSIRAAATGKFSSIFLENQRKYGLTFHMNYMPADDVPFFSISDMKINIDQIRPVNYTT